MIGFNHYVLMIDNHNPSLLLIYNSKLLLVSINKDRIKIIFTLFLRLFLFFSFVVISNLMSGNLNKLEYPRILSMI